MKEESTFDYGNFEAKLLFKALVITDVFYYFFVKKVLSYFVTNAVCSVTKV